MLHEQFFMCKKIKISFKAQKLLWISPECLDAAVTLWLDLVVQLSPCIVCVSKKILELHRGCRYCKKTDHSSHGIDIRMCPQGWSFDEKAEAGNRSAQCFQMWSRPHVDFGKKKKTFEREPLHAIRLSASWACLQNLALRAATNHVLHASYRADCALQGIERRRELQADVTCLSAQLSSLSLS